MGRLITCPFSFVWCDTTDLFLILVIDKGGGLSYALNMSNRKMLAVLVGVTLAAALTNGCTVGDSHPVFQPSDYGDGSNDARVGNPPLCDYGFHPCGSVCVDQNTDCSEVSTEEIDPSGDLSLVANPDDPDVCENPDHYGCPGMPCAHGWCAEGTCEGRVIDEQGNTVDPGVCCTDVECDAG